MFDFAVVVFGVSELFRNGCLELGDTTCHAEVGVVREETLKSIAMHTSRTIRESTRCHHVPSYCLSAILESSQYSLHEFAYQAVMCNESIFTELPHIE